MFSVHDDGNVARLHVAATVNVHNVNDVAGIHVVATTVLLTIKGV